METACCPISTCSQLTGRSTRSCVAGCRCRMATTFSWSPNSDALAYHTYGGGPGRVALLALDGTERVLDDGSEVDFGHEEPYPPPLWSADGRFLYCWSVDTQIYRLATDTGARQNMAPDQQDYRLLGPTYPLTGMIASDFGRPGTVVVVGRHRRTEWARRCCD